ncbi:MAG: efflux RND transporter periplasmic adaptor subunit [Terriglobia bacterium]
MKNYRSAFFATLVVSLLLAGALTFFLYTLHHRRNAASAALKQEPEAGAAPTPGNANSPGASPNPSVQAAATTPAAASAQPPLVPLQLSPQRTQSIGVKTGVVQYKDVQNSISTAGNVAVDERLESSVQLRFAGWIGNVYVNSTYQFVRKGQPLFTIYSPDLVSTEREYLLAKENNRLLGASAVPGVASGAASLLAASSGRLQQWGVPANEIKRLENTGNVSQELTFNSPVTGYVTERNALPHMYAQPETKLYAITGLSTVWVYADIFQNEIGQVRVGYPVAVTVDSYPGRTFHGRVDFIWPQVDPTTRTIKVRLIFANPGLKLMPGMFVNVSLNIPLGRHLVIPASGVFQSGSRQEAFVDLGNGVLEPREIELGPRAGNEFVVLKGLRAGEAIVTSANFLIDSESQLEAAGGTFVPPPPGAGAAAAMSAAGPKSQAHIDFTTQPSPPHQGANAVQVTLARPDGAPLAGAQVSVTFFMPAMPAMGMGALRVSVPMRERSGGLYEGQCSLPSGGAWQVAILAQLNGQTVATKQLSVGAEGGM